MTIKDGGIDLHLPALGAPLKENSRYVIATRAACTKNMCTIPAACADANMDTRTRRGSFLCGDEPMCVVHIYYIRVVFINK